MCSIVLTKRLPKGGMENGRVVYVFAVSCLAKHYSIGHNFADGLNFS